MYNETAVDPTGSCLARYINVHVPCLFGLTPGKQVDPEIPRSFGGALHVHGASRTASRYVKRRRLALPGVQMFALPGSETGTGLYCPEYKCLRLFGYNFQGPALIARDKNVCAPWVCLTRRDRGDSPWMG